MDNIEVVKINEESFQVVETIPEKTVIVPEEKRITTYNVSDLRQNIAMQESVVGDKQMELEAEQAKLDDYNSLLKQGQEAEIMKAEPAQIVK